jgi:hypothetical protein
VKGVVWHKDGCVDRGHRLLKEEGCA